MAMKRMISQEVIVTDDFLALPHSAQALYFMLLLTADNEGFHSAPRDVMTRTRTSPDDFKALIDKGFIIPIDTGTVNTGVMVIRHWFVHNYSRNDRGVGHFNNIDEKKKVTFDDEGLYVLIEVIGNDVPSLYDLIKMNGGKPLSRTKILELLSCSKGVQSNFTLPSGIPVGAIEEREGRIEEKREEERVEENGCEIPLTPNHLYGEKNNVFLWDDEVQKIYQTYQDPKDLINKISYIFINSKKSYASHYAFLRKVALEDKWPLKPSQKEVVQKQKEKEEQEKRKKAEEEKEKQRIEEIMAEDSLTEEEARKKLGAERQASHERLMAEIKEKLRT